MTLRQFLKATTGIPEPRLRCAMAAALTVEPARSPAEYRRFYRRVIEVLREADRREAASKRPRRLSTARPSASPP